MNRRNFLKSVTGFVAGVVAAFVPKAKADDEVGKTLFTVSNTIPDKLFERRSDVVCKFYINGEEVDVNRVVDEYGALHWPFKGAKKGDLCEVRSPALSFKIV